MSSIQLLRFGFGTFRLPKVSSVNGRHQTLCLWCWKADLLPPCRPHHVTHFPSPVTGQRPCWMWESLSFPWGPECHLRAIFLGCQRGLSLRLNNLLDVSLPAKELLRALQEPPQWFLLTLSRSTDPSQNIHAYTGI